MAYEVYVFLAFIVAGAVIGVIFDFFRAFRKVVKSNTFFVTIQDIIFWVITGLIILFVTYFVNSGELRAYCFLGLFLGAGFYVLTLSKIIILIFAQIIKIVVAPINLIIKAITNMLLKIVSALKYIKK